MLAARIAETCFFIGFSPFLPFGLCGASSFCVPRDVSILENFFHFVQRWNSQEKLSFLYMLHKSHPHSCKIHAFLSVFLAFHGKIASFLIYYKMKTTFTFENFLSHVRFGAAKQKGAHPLHLRVSAFALVVGYSFCQKNARCQNETSFSRNLSQFLHICTKAGRFFREKASCKRGYFPI